ncbi:MAG: LmeA family phospholipid-binding protein [Acidimicrobiales bacterium]
MKKLLVVVLIVAVIFVALDLVARVFVEGQVEASAERELERVAAVDAGVGSFLFLPFLLARGEVSRFSLRLSDVVDQQIELAELDIDVRGIELDRGSLFDESRVRITGVDEVTMTAVIDESSIGRFVEPLGATLELEPGRVRVSALGRTAEADVRFEGRSLVIGAGPIGEVSIPLPSTEVMPCEFEARVADGQVEMTCTGDELPPLVVRAIGSIDLREELGG